MLSIFDHIKIENTYELFFPKKEQGLAIIWLYERFKKGDFDKGMFKEADIQQALDEVSMISRETRERYPWEYYNSQIMALQEFFILYDEENQVYTFKEYATYLCEKVIKMLSDRFNPTIIEITCTDLYDKLKTIDLSIWMDAYFDKAKLHLKEQIDFLNQQIDKSVKEFSDKTKLKSDNLLVALQDIDNKLDEISLQNKELRGAFRAVDQIKDILMMHPERDNADIDDKINAAIDYLESVRILLNMVDTRINKIQPKIQQFFATLDRQVFDVKVEKFLIYLLDKSHIASSKLILPLINDSFSTQLPSSNFTIIEKRSELFLEKKQQPVIYINDPKKEAIAHQRINWDLVRQNHINSWLDRISYEILHVNEYHLSDIFFKILEVHHEDLQMAVSVIYQSIYFYDKHESWYIEINDKKNIQIENSNYIIWDIWMKRK